jgi:PAS domain S-box-containing protein
MTQHPSSADGADRAISGLPEAGASSARGAFDAAGAPSTGAPAPVRGDGGSGSTGRLADADAFRSLLSDSLRPLADPIQVQTVAVRMLGEHLAVGRVMHAEVEADGDTITIGADYCRPGVPSVVGSHRLADFGVHATADLRAGRTAVVEDVRMLAALSPIERAAYAAIGIRSFVTVPLVKDRRLVALLSVHETAPRGWTAAEVALIEDVAERTWSAVEQARAEAAQRASDTRYRMLFDAIDEGFCVLEVIFDDADRAIDYRYIEMNPAFEKHTGWTDAIGRCVRELAPDMEEQWFETYGRVALTGEAVRFIDESEPMQRWFDVFAFRIDAPALRRVAVLFTDITERKRAEAERDRLLLETEAARAEAEKASAAKSQFISTMSHELRTPLTAVIGISDLLADEIMGPLNPRQRAYLTRVKDSAWHLVSIIDEILVFTRSEAGKEEVRIADVDVAELTRGVIDMLGADADTRGLELALHGADDRLIALTDAGKVRQILTNLVGNALKYTDDGRVMVELSAAADTIVLRVSDTGPGIANDRLADIFEPFVQVDGSSTRTRGGTGLGLTIAQKLATLIGGIITVESEPGVGSTFTLTFPRRSRFVGSGPREQA